jgi:hypothetical protein
MHLGGHLTARLGRHRALKSSDAAPVPDGGTARGVASSAAGRRAPRLVVAHPRLATGGEAFGGARLRSVGRPRLAASRLSAFCRGRELRRTRSPLAQALGDVGVRSEATVSSEGARGVLGGPSLPPPPPSSVEAGCARGNSGVFPRTVGVAHPPGRRLYWAVLEAGLPVPRGFFGNRGRGCHAWPPLA